MFSVDHAEQERRQPQRAEKTSSLTSLKRSAQESIRIHQDPRARLVSHDPHDFSLTTFNYYSSSYQNCICFSTAGNTRVGSYLGIWLFRKTCLEVRSSPGALLYPSAKAINFKSQHLWHLWSFKSHACVNASEFVYQRNLWEYGAKIDSQFSEQKLMKHLLIWGI